MKMTMNGKNIKITNALRNIVEKKISRLEKYFDPDITAHATLRVEKNSQSIEVTIPFNGVILRGEETTDDMYASIDLVIDKLERQIRKQKTKLEKRNHGGSLRFQHIPIYEPIGEAKEEKEKIVKTKKFAIKPMNNEEAALQMELLGHNFFVYKNADTGDVNVLYKRKDGNYGLIEPEF